MCMYYGMDTFLLVFVNVWYSNLHISVLLYSDFCKGYI